MERDVTLLEMLEAREDRARRLEALRTRHGSAAVSFTLNIAGPVKDSPLIRRAFQAGLEQLEAGLRAAGLAVLDRLERRAPTGCEAQYAVDGPVRELQRACVSIEDGSPLGRLFELDVLTPEGRRLDREAAGGAPRRCLVCGAPGTRWGPPPNPAWWTGPTPAATGIWIFLPFTPAPPPCSPTGPTVCSWARRLRTSLRPARFRR